VPARTISRAKQCQWAFTPFVFMGFWSTATFFLLFRKSTTPMRSSWWLHAIAVWLKFFRRRLFVADRQIAKTMRRMARRIVFRSYQHCGSNDLKAKSMNSSSPIFRLAVVCAESSDRSTLIKEGFLFIEDCQDCHTHRCGNLHLAQISVGVALDAAPLRLAQKFCCTCGVRIITDSTIK
jgi:hypothetical protein